MRGKFIVRRRQSITGTDCCGISRSGSTAAELRKCKHTLALRTQPSIDEGCINGEDCQVLLGDQDIWKSSKADWSDRIKAIIMLYLFLVRKDWGYTQPEHWLDPESSPRRRCQQIECCEAVESASRWLRRRLIPPCDCGVSRPATVAPISMTQNGMRKLVAEVFAWFEVNKKFREYSQKTQPAIPFNLWIVGSEENVDMLLSEYEIERIGFYKVTVKTESSTILTLIFRPQQSLAKLLLATFWCLEIIAFILNRVSPPLVKLLLDKHTELISESIHVQNENLSVVNAIRRCLLLRQSAVDTHDTWRVSRLQMSFVSFSADCSAMFAKYFNCATAFNTTSISSLITLHLCQEAEVFILILHNVDDNPLAILEVDQAVFKIVDGLSDATDAALTPEINHFQTKQSRRDSIWSLGCILGEIAQYFARTILHPGSTLRSTLLSTMIQRVTIPFMILFAGPTTAESPSALLEGSGEMQESAARLLKLGAVKDFLREIIGVSCTIESCFNARR